MEGIIKWFSENGMAIIGILWGIDQILKVIAPLTPTKIDDNLADYLGKFLAKFAKKTP